MKDNDKEDAYQMNAPQNNKPPLQPIQDKGTSPSILIQNKRNSLKKDEPKVQFPPTDAGAMKIDEQDRGTASRMHQVNYSFGQQPFKELQHLSTRVMANSGQNSIRGVGGVQSPVTAQIGGAPNSNGGKNSGPVMSSMRSMASESNANSKEQKSAISMASVMGQFDQHAIGNNGIPNIFAQSLQNQQIESGQQKLPVTSQVRSNAKPTPVSQSAMNQTASNFAMTANKVDQMEKMVQDGLSMGERRRSQHSLEAESMGLRKSQEGVYEDITKKDKNDARKQKVDNIVNRAQFMVGQTVNAVEQDGKVPKAIMDLMLQKGFRPSSKHEGQFEYESDTIEQYEMISNEFDFEEVRKGSNFGIKQYKDCIYRGQLNTDRKREGLGVLVYSNGRVYEGEWLKNKRHGRGYEVFPNGNSFQGTYENGKANGKGVYQWQNGEVYDGEWKEGIKHGYGVWKGSNGESYIGQWVNSKAQGYGVHVFANGDKYEGEWHQCLREGNGSDFFANGDCYVGQYLQGKPEGFGQYKWKNGSSYTGQFVNGLKHGHGKWKKKQADEFGQTKCNSYEGLYEHDKKHGYGVFEWESGNRYEGNYQEDERHGYGVMRWTDESVYMGVWNQGIQHGIGVMIFPDGVRRAGIFEENVFKESLKRKDQIDPFRELLKEDCLALLEEILQQREQSKANLFGPLQKSKAELMQNDLNNTELNLGDSISAAGRGTSEGRQLSIKNSGGQLAPSNLNDFASENQSLLNHPMKNADKEDYNMTMQKGNPMRESIGKGAQNKHYTEESVAPLPPLPATATPKVHGRTIEVQTDLSMVTMEQYSQNNSKAIMNKTHDFKGIVDRTNDSISIGSPNIKYQNDMSNPSVFDQHSNNEFKNMLLKPQFQDTKHQREILGGGNPNEDTESEWNRNNSSMMVRKPNLLNGTQGSSNISPQPAFGAFEFQNNQVQPSKTRPMAQKNSVSNPNRSMSRRKRSNINELSHPRRLNNQPYRSPYASHNMIDRQKQVYGNSMTNPRENKFIDRSSIPNRQGHRQERSLPPQSTTMHTQMGPIAGDGFIVPGPQNPSKQNRSINRHNVLNVLQQESRKPPQKMFQSQYGNSRFGGAPLHGNQAQPVAQLPGQLYSHNNSVMQQYPPLMDSPEVQYKGYAIPNSEQPPSLNHSRVENSGEQPGLPFIGGLTAVGAPKQHDTPVVHQNMKRNYPPSNFAMRQYVNGFSNSLHDTAENPREDILTPSPKMNRSSNRQSKASAGYNPNFNRSVGQNAFQYNKSTMDARPLNEEMAVGAALPRRNSNDVSAGNDNGLIAVEPMFGPNYIQQAAKEARNVKEYDYNTLTADNRVKTTTSSQRTLRYNDFELIQKDFQKDPRFELQVDEGDEKDSSRSADDRKRVTPVGESVSYPDIQMNRLYESKNAKVNSNNSNQAPPFGSGLRSSRHSLPKMALNNQSIQNQEKGERKRRHLNSNDTQLASHTINMHASNAENSIQDSSSARRDEGIMPKMRTVQRSLPARNQPSKISVKDGIGIMNPHDLRVGRFAPANKNSKGGSPNQNNQSGTASIKFINTKNLKRGGGHDGSNSHSKGRFDFTGPYAQNLKKPKLYEARGTQKIAMKNHLASLQQQKALAQQKGPKSVAGGGGPRFNSQDFPKEHGQVALMARNEVSRNAMQPIHNSQVEDRGDKHTARFASLGIGHRFDHQSNLMLHQENSQTGVHQVASGGTLQMPPVSGFNAMSHEHNMKHKRVWVPYNKKIKLKGMQSSMRTSQNGRLQNSNSHASGNPLLQSNT